MADNAEPETETVAEATEAAPGTPTFAEPEAAAEVEQAPEPEPVEEPAPVAEPEPETETVAVPAEPVVIDGQVLMRNADGTGCSYRGVSYEPDERGIVAVPAHAVAELFSVGFVYET